jgi:glycosyltransferase involved in cell wall biosynthesis
MKILGLIYSPSQASSRVRIIQFKDYLKENNAILNTRYFTPYKDQESSPSVQRLLKKLGMNYEKLSQYRKSFSRLPLIQAAKKYDIIWQNRLLVLHNNNWESKIKRPLVFDLDDAIWMTEGKDLVIKRIKESQIVFAGNSYLADFASAFNQNVAIIPSVIDTRKLFPIQNNGGQFVIGWIGTKSNFKYLELIKKQLLDFLTINKDVVLEIVSSEPPPFLPFNTNIIFKKWNEADENHLINNFSVGIMPLQDAEWEKGKCGYKLLQYLACGKPAIVSPVGVNKEIAKNVSSVLWAEKNTDWSDCLNEVKRNYDSYKNKTNEGVDLITNQYSCQFWTPKIITHFNSIRQ